MAVAIANRAIWTVDHELALVAVRRRPALVDSRALGAVCGGWPPALRLDRPLARTFWYDVDVSTLRHSSSSVEVV